MVVARPVYALLSAVRLHGDIMYVERAVFKVVTVEVLIFVITVSTCLVTEVTSIVEVTKG